MKLKIRKMNEADRSFIFSSWLKSYRATGPIGKKKGPNGEHDPEGIVKINDPVKHINNTVYFHEQQELIERLFKDSTIIVACDTEQEDIVLGYLCYDKNPNGSVTIHYMYVKGKVQKLGLAKSMLKFIGLKKDIINFCSHITLDGKRIASKFNVVYNPYILKLK